MPWQTVLALLQVLVSAASPMLKQAALAELKSLEGLEVGHPFFLSLIKEAEVLVAAA